MKHHPATHHKHTRKEFLTPHIVLEMLRIEQSRDNIIAAAAAYSDQNQSICEGVMI